MRNKALLPVLPPILQEIFHCRQVGHPVSSKALDMIGPFDQQELLLPGGSGCQLLLAVAMGYFSVTITVDQ